MLAFNREELKAAGIAELADADDAVIKQLGDVMDSILEQSQVAGYAGVRVTTSVHDELMHIRAERAQPKASV